MISLAVIQPTNIALLSRSVPMSTHPQSAGELLSETSLDPVDWLAFRASAHQALDDAIEFLQSVRERPVWQPVPEDVRTALLTPFPQTGQSLDQVYKEFTQLILPYSTGNTHPRFFGWVHGTGMANGIIAEMLAAALNANCGGRDHGAIYVEHAVLGWFKELFHLPDQASGLIVSGTSIANLIALAVARNTDDVWGMRTDGLQERPGRLIAYTSSEAHECLVKAMEVLGLGANQLRRVPVDNAYRMDLGSLCEQIEADRAAGY